MKLFKNLMVAAACVSVFAGVSAMADGLTLDAYNEANNSISVKEISTAVSGLGDQLVVACVPEGASSISAENLFYINTDSTANASTLLTDMLLSSGIEANKTYEIWLGGTQGSKKVAKFTTGGQGEVIWGDANGDLSVTTADSVIILQKLAKYDVTVKEPDYDAAYDGQLTTADSVRILQWLAKYPVPLGPTEE